MHPLLGARFAENNRSSWDRAVLENELADDIANLVESLVIIARANPVKEDTIVRPIEVFSDRVGLLYLLELAAQSVWSAE